eukprot:Amastigsp_a175336_22.p7 type:complete len:101 gc:universal Amastigsp_a175336_22:2373-2071(-)
MCRATRGGQGARDRTRPQSTRRAALWSPVGTARRARWARRNATADSLCRDTRRSRPCTSQPDTRRSRRDTRPSEHRLRRRRSRRKGCRPETTWPTGRSTT